MNEHAPPEEIVQGDEPEPADSPTDAVPATADPPVEVGDPAPSGKLAPRAGEVDVEQDMTGGGLPSGPTLSFAFNLAKVAGHGEDSDPIVRDGRDLGLIAVFDGMGGAGGTVYETPDGPRTGAYLASRVARDVVEQRMLDLLDPEWNLDGLAAARDLQQAVKESLASRLAELNAPASGLRSRLLRALPTTMALIALQRRDPAGERWTGHLLWSGDSRVYTFDPHSGAHQLTLDDIRDRGDAMANLREDSVVSNAMSADVDFVVHHRKVELSTPFLAVAATDGCFGYVPSPMHFEHLVLSALRDSPDVDGWSAALQSEISKVTGDDAAMSVLGVGADLNQFRDLFAARTAELQERWVRPLDQLDGEARRAQRELDDLRRQQGLQQAQLWAAYKPGYERYLSESQQEGR